MVLLLVSNVHFNSAGSSRIEYTGSNSFNIVVNSGGVKFTQNTITPITANGLSLATSSFRGANLHIASNRTIDMGSNVQIKHTSSGLRIEGAGYGYAFNSLMYVAGGGAPTNLNKPSVQIFTSSGTWSKPTGCRKIKVTAIGAGGGGGGAQYSADHSGGAGGESGAIGIKWIDVSSWSNSTTVTIGTGGSGGAASGGTGSAGGTTSFGAHLSCPGGTGGQGMTAASTAQIKGGNYTGSSATGGDINGKCSPGLPGIRNFGSSAKGGDGGPGIFKNMAPGNYQTSSQSPVAGLYGGGGAGAHTETSGGKIGGAGGDGMVIVEEFY